MPEETARPTFPQVEIPPFDPEAITRTMKAVADIFAKATAAMRAQGLYGLAHAGKFGELARRLEQWPADELTRLSAAALDLDTHVSAEVARRVAECTP